MRLQLEREKNSKDVNVFAERIQFLEKALNAHESNQPVSMQTKDFDDGVNQARAVDKEMKDNYYFDIRSASIFKENPAEKYQDKVQKKWTQSQIDTGNKIPYNSE